MIHDDYAASLLGHIVAAWGYKANEIMGTGLPRYIQQDVYDINSVFILLSRDLYGLTTEAARVLLRDHDIVFWQRGKPLPSGARGLQWMDDNPRQAARIRKGLPDAPVVTREVMEAWAQLEPGYKRLTLCRRHGLHKDWCKRVGDKLEGKKGELQRGFNE